MGRFRRAYTFSFFFALLLLALWLSLLVEPIQSRYGQAIVYALSGLLFWRVFLAIREKEALAYERHDLLLWGYLLVVTAGIFFARDHTVAWRMARSYLLPIPVLYYLFKNSKLSFSAAKKCAVFICILSSVVSVYAMIEMFLHENVLYEYFVDNEWYRIFFAEYRAISTQLVPAALGTYLISGVPISYFLIRNANSIREEIIGMFSLAASLIAIILTFSRGAVFSLVFLSCLYFYQKSKKAVIGVIAGTVMVIAVFSVFLHSETGAHRLSIQHLLFQNTYFDAKVSRLVTTLKMLKDHPFIGVGLGQYRIHFDTYHFTPYVNYFLKTPDNMHLMILGESGLGGYLCFIAWVIVLLWRGLRSGNEFCFACSTAVAGILVNMCTYDLLYWTVPFYLFWIYCGISASFTSNVRR